MSHFDLQYLDPVIVATSFQKKIKSLNQIFFCCIELHFDDLGIWPGTKVGVMLHHLTRPFIINGTMYIKSSYFHEPSTTYYVLRLYWSLGGSFLGTCPKTWKVLDNFWQSEPFSVADHFCLICILEKWVYLSIFYKV